MQSRDPSVVNPSPSFTLFDRLFVFMHALFFVLGFSAVFVIGFGGAATILGGILFKYKTLLSVIGGVVLIIFGLATMDVIHIPWFYRDTRPEYRGKTGTYWGSFLMGIFFAAGWSPCIGATLGAILTLGFSQETISQALLLTTGYSLGLGIPFLAMALVMNEAVPVVRRLGKYMRTFQIISGVLIIAIGLLLVFNRFTLLASWAQQTGLYLDLPSSPFRVPGYLTAVAAGLLSFLSPCVLPLVPAYLGYLSGYVIAKARNPVPTNE